MDIGRIQNRTLHENCHSLTKFCSAPAQACARSRDSSWKTLSGTMPLGKGERDRHCRSVRRLAKQLVRQNPITIGASAQSLWARRRGAGGVAETTAFQFSD